MKQGFKRYPSLRIEVLTIFPEMFQALDSSILAYRSMSRELTLDEWMQQPLRSTILDNLARLTSALQ